MIEPVIARVPSRLVWRNLTHNRARLAVGVTGVAFAVFLMVFQGSLLVGFITAAQLVIRSADVDVWLVPRGVPCFDFSARLPEGLAERARGVDGVADTRRIAAGFTTWRRPDGQSRPVLLIGADARGFEQGALPMPVRPDGTGLAVDGVVVDASNAAFLQVRALPAFVEIAGRRAEVVRLASEFTSFLGSPYVFATHDVAGRMLGLGAEETSYIGLRLAPGADAEAVSTRLARRLPDVTVLTRNRFAWQSTAFWLLQTGAGGAILTAALLGFIVGLVIVSQTLYAGTLEHLREYAVLKAMGASDRVLRRVVVLQALALGAAGSVAGLILVDPLAKLARVYLVPWVVTPGWLKAGAVVMGLAMCAAGALASVRAVTRVDPEVVFRA